ncbi:MAG: exosortase B [Burkholderiaceae bacterium]
MVVSPHTQAPSRPFDSGALVIVALGLALLWLPTFWDLNFGIWSAEAQGHELIVLGVSAWLLYRQRAALRDLPDAPALWGGSGLLVLGLLLYAFGRSQQFYRVEMLALIGVLVAALVLFKGWAVLRLIWFPLLFLLFAMPLPYSLVLAVTAPLKLGVSIVATQLLLWLGFPMGRSGVVMTIGQYQLLVSEACAGLQTMFTLEAMGLLYASLMNYRSWVRNGLLAVLVIPVAFFANVVRVMVLVLVTYYFGDAAGRGFIHGFAGMVLFAVGLAFIFGADRVLGVLLPKRWAV